MRFGCLILLMFVVLACGQEKKKETVNPLAYAVITGHNSFLLECTDNTGMRDQARSHFYFSFSAFGFA